MALMFLTSFVYGSQTLTMQAPTKAGKIQTKNDLLRLPTGQALSVSLISASEAGSGKPVKSYGVTVEGFKERRFLAVTVADVESTLEDFYKLDFRSGELQPIVDVLNKKNAPSQTFKIGGYEKKVSPTVGDQGSVNKVKSPGQLIADIVDIGEERNNKLGGVSSCNLKEDLPSIQKVLDEMNAQNALELWKVHTDQISDCKKQVVAGLKLSFKVRLGTKLCPFSVVTLNNEVTLLNPLELLFACSKIF